MEGLTKQRIIGETLLFMLIEFGAMILLLLIEKIEVLSSAILIVISVIYGIAVYFASKPTKKGDVGEMIFSSNKKRIGVGIVFFITITLATYIFPYRPLNILAVFMTLDVLLSLLPGKIVFYGNHFWKWSKLMYILTLLVSLGFLFINLFSIPFASVNTFFTYLFGNLFIILVIIIIVLAIAGFLGYRKK